MFPEIELSIPENKQNARAMTGPLGIFLVLMYQHGVDEEETDRVLKYAHLMQISDIIKDFVRGARCYSLLASLRISNSAILKLPLFH